MLIHPRPRTSLLLPAAALAAGLALPAGAENPRQLLEGSLDPRDTVYTGVQVAEVTRPNGRKSVQRQQVTRRNNLLRIDYANGQILFDNGQTMLLYLPRQNVVEEGPSRLQPGRAAGLRRSLRNRRVQVELLADGTVAGRPAYVVQVTPPNRPSRKIWIDKQTHLQLRLDESRPDGRSVSTYFTRIDFDADPPVARVEYTPPPGIPRVERGRPIPEARAAELARPWGGLLKPKFLPPGYRFRGYFQHVFKGKPVVVAVYAGSKPREVLSLFQGPMLGTGGMKQRPSGKLGVLSARRGTADVTVVAPLPDHDLERVMDSMESG